MYFERYFLQLDDHTILQALHHPLNLVQMDPAAFIIAQTDHSIAFQCREKGQTQTANQFQVLGGGIPTIKQDAFRLDFLGKDSVDDHFSEMIVLDLAILIWRINAVVNGWNSFWPPALCTKLTTPMPRTKPCSAQIFDILLLGYHDLMVSSRHSKRKSCLERDQPYVSI